MPRWQSILFALVNLTALLASAPSAQLATGPDIPPSLTERERTLARASKAMRIANDAAHRTGLQPATSPPVLAAPPQGASSAVSGNPSVSWPYSAAPIETVTMGVHAVFVSDDDGSQAVTITPAEVAQMVTDANVVFASSGIVLEFDPQAGAGDWEWIQNSLLNEMYGVGHPQWAQQKAAGDAIASLTPDEMVVFFRWGPDPTPTGMGFSWTDYDFIVMPGGLGTDCGLPDMGWFAHEAGHYLGLFHTMGAIFDTEAQALAHFLATGSDPQVYEGDGRTDTFPDPYVSALHCDGTATSLDLAGTVFPLPRTNVMSYYTKNPVVEASPSQGWTARQVAVLRSGQSLDTLVPGVGTATEGESLIPVVTGGTWDLQEMTTIFHGRWSGGSQLFWIDGALGDCLTTSISVPSGGTFDLYASVTAAPDYGIHAHSINGQQLATVDLYSNAVLPVGPVFLGRAELSSGPNPWEVTVAGSNPLAWPRHAFGVDYLLAVPVMPWLPQGTGVAGVSGLPMLQGTGTMGDNSLNEVALSGAAPSATAGLFIALSSTPVPFKGGMIYPGPLLIGPQLFTTDGAGEIALPFVWPSGAPQGTELWLQWAIQDASAVHGVALSNALVGHAP
jgi:hypothetical protein